MYFGEANFFIEAFISVKHFPITFLDVLLTAVRKDCGFTENYRTIVLFYLVSSTMLNNR